MNHAFLIDSDDHCHAVRVRFLVLPTERQEATRGSGETKLCTTWWGSFYPVERLGAMGRNQLFATILL